MDAQKLKNIVEAALLAAGRPMSIEQLLNLFPENEAPERQDVRTALESLEGEYAERGIQLREVASGWRIQVREEMSAWLSRLWQDRPARYSRALLETLALIAYRQPITRGEIEDIRGVSVSSNIMRTLMERGWVRIVGHRDVPGRPGMYATTREFLDYFGLKRLEDLPPLAEIRDLDSINVELDLGLGLTESASEPPQEEAEAYEEETDAESTPDVPRA
jgi:segregation and condensation protein B